MAKTRSRRGSRRNLTRRGGGKGSGGMEVEGSKVQASVKGKSMKHGAKGKTHTVIRKTKANIALNKKRRAEAKAEKYLQKYRAALAAVAAATVAAGEDEEDEDEEDEEEEEDEEDEEEDFEKAMENASKPGYKPYVSKKEEENAQKETEMYEMFKKL